MHLARNHVSLAHFDTHHYSYMDHQADGYNAASQLQYTRNPHKPIRDSRYIHSPYKCALRVVAALACVPILAMILMSANLAYIY